MGRRAGDVPDLLPLQVGDALQRRPLGDEHLLQQGRRLHHRDDLEVAATSRLAGEDGRDLARLRHVQIAGGHRLELEAATVKRDVLNLVRRVRQTRGLQIEPLPLISGFTDPQGYATEIWRARRGRGNGGGLVRAPTAGCYGGRQDERRNHRRKSTQSLPAPPG